MNLAAATENQGKRPVVDDQGFTPAAKGKSAPATGGGAQQSIVEQAASQNRFALLGPLLPPTVTSVSGPRKSTDSQKAALNPANITRNADDKSPSAAKVAIPAVAPAVPMYPGLARSPSAPTTAQPSTQPLPSLKPSASSAAPKHGMTTDEATAARLQGLPTIVRNQLLKKLGAVELEKRDADAATTATGKVVEPEKKPAPMELEDVNKMLGGKLRGKWGDSDESSECWAAGSQSFGYMSKRTRAWKV